jgi:16S rRNA (adenine1518-N6/adenine1519-N6)-dimethyltransferase
MSSNGVRAKKSLGQHWLKDKSVLENIAGTALVHEHDLVLEVGPGLGTLTDVLLSRGAGVIAVEMDEKLADKLSRAKDSPRLEVVQGDILKFDLTKLPKNYKVVANIPYYLTSHLLRILAESANPPKQITLLVQKEVARRICAKPGDMSLLSVSAQFYFDTELGRMVPARLFSPPPKVDSQVVNMFRRTKLPLDAKDTKEFFRIAKAGFANRRKILLNSLAGGLDKSKEEIATKLQIAHIDPGARSQELSINQWLRLFRALA